MRLFEHGAPRSGLASAARPSTTVNPLISIVSFIDKTLVIAELEARKLRHDPTELLTRAVQPALWLLVFGEVFTRVRAIPTGNMSYIDFMSPGILAQSVLFIAIFYGIAIIWERDLGIVHKFLASPTPRAALVLGKALLAVITVLVQQTWGNTGLVLLSAIVGVTDIDPFILSLVHNTVQVYAAVVSAIIIAMMSNTVIKGVYFGTLAKGT